MGNPYIYWYPERTAGLETIDLGAGGLSDFRQWPVSQGRAKRALGGQVWPSPYGSFQEVTAGIDMITDQAIRRALLTFETHVQGARMFGVSNNHAKSWAGMTTNPLVRAQTVIPTGGNAFAAYNNSAALAASDVVVIESAWPECRREWAVVSSVSGNTITLSAGLKYNHTAQPVLIRHETFFPLVAQIRGEPIVDQVAGDLIVALNIDVVTCQRIVAELIKLGDILPGSTDSTGKTSPFDLVRKQTGRGTLGLAGTFSGRQGGTK